MPGPIPHHLASGIHPASFVQATEPPTTDLQDGTEWTDTSAGPPYVRKVWRTGTGAWDVLQMDSTGYPFPAESRISEETVQRLADPDTAPILSAAVAIFNPWPNGAYEVVYTLEDPDGHETLASPSSTITVDGTQWIHVQLPPSIPSVPDLPDLASWNAYITMTTLLTGTVTFRTNVSSGTSVDLIWATGSTTDSPPSSNTTTKVVLRAYDPTALLTLEVPLPAAAGTPSQIVAKDPSSGLPAFSAAPVALPATGWTTPPIPAVAGPALVTTRCGAAVAMADKLERMYANVSSWLNGLESLVAGLLLNAVMDLLIEAITDGGATPWLITNQRAVKTAANFIILHAVGSDFPTLNSAQDADILSSAFCALPADVSNLVMTDAVISDWQTGLSAFSADFPGPGFNLDLLGLLIGCVSTDAWHQAAYLGAAAPSTACAGIVCP